MTKMRGSILAAVLCAGIVVAQNSNHHSTSHIQVQVPSSLTIPGGYNHSEALFGTGAHRQHGATIMQPLYYADSDLCDTNTDRRKGYPTRPKDESGIMKPWPSPYILMADRGGGCTFVQKVRNAQQSGAAALLIADHTCLCSNPHCQPTPTTNTTTPPPCQTTLPSLSDDGSSSDVTIPAFLLPKSSADAIRSHMRTTDRPVEVELSWSAPDPDGPLDIVEYGLWSSPKDEMADSFRKGWVVVLKHFEGRVRFTPRQFVKSGAAICVGDGREEVVCEEHCTNGGRYCAWSPEDGNGGVGVKGKKVVEEGLRRICVWRYYGEDGLGDEAGVKYLEYVSKFAEECAGVESFVDPKCRDAIMKRLGIDHEIVKSCMQDSGGTSTTGENILLEREILAIEENGVVVSPSVYVNLIHLNEDLTVPNVFTAVCAGFIEGNAPDICGACTDCNDLTACMTAGSCASRDGGDGGGGRGVTKRFLGLSLLLLCSVFGAIGLTQWRKTREEMRDHVRVILAEYMPLEGGDEETSVVDAEGREASLIE